MNDVMRRIVDRALAIWRPVIPRRRRVTIVDVATS